MLPFPSNNHSNKRSRLLTEHFLCAQHYWSTLHGRPPGTHSTHRWWELLYPLQQMRKLLPSPTLVTLMPLIPPPFSFSSSTRPLLTFSVGLYFIVCLCTVEHTFFKASYLCVFTAICHIPITVTGIQFCSTNSHWNEIEHATCSRSYMYSELLC